MRAALILLTAALAGVTLSAAEAGAQRGRARPVELTLAQVVDSARLTDEVRQLAGRPVSGASVYVVGYDSTGAVEDVYVLGRDSHADSAVAAVLRRLVSPRLEPRTYESLYVRAEWGGTATLATYHPRKEREPQVQNRGTLAQLFGDVGSRFTLVLRPQGETVELRIRVDEAGNPLDIHVSRRTGLPALDQAVLDVARRIRFRPAMIDDIPVRVWVTLPITIMPAPVPDPAGARP
jgi:TonB family protein